MSPLEERPRRLEDVAAIRTLDATYCRLLDGGDWPGHGRAIHRGRRLGRAQPVQGHRDLLAFSAAWRTPGMSVCWHHVSNHETQLTGDSARVRSLGRQPCVVDGVPHVAAGRYADELTRAGGGWRYRFKRVRFSYWDPLAKRWDQHRFALEFARSAAVPRRTPA